MHILYLSLLDCSTNPCSMEVPYYPYEPIRNIYMNFKLVNNIYYACIITHRTFGCGCPVALHLSWAAWPSDTMTSFDVSSSMISGGTTTSNVPDWNLNENNLCFILNCGNIYLQYCVVDQHSLGTWNRYINIFNYHFCIKTDKISFLHVRPSIVLLNIFDVKSPSIMPFILQILNR